MVSKGRTPLYPDDILWNFEKIFAGRMVRVVAVPFFAGYDA